MQPQPRFPLPQMGQIMQENVVPENKFGMFCKIVQFSQLVQANGLLPVGKKILTPVYRSQSIHDSLLIEFNINQTAAIKKGLHVRLNRRFCGQIFDNKPQKLNFSESEEFALIST